MGLIGRISTNRSLARADEEQLRDALFERVVVLTRSCDRTRAGVGGRLVFRAWLYRELRFDAIDFLLQWFGRDGHKRVDDSRIAEAAAGLDDRILQWVDASRLPPRIRDLGRLWEPS